MTTRRPAFPSAFAAWLPMYPAPPVTRTTRGSAATNGVIREPVLLHLVRGEQVAAVDDHRRSHERPHALEVRTAELVPLGHDRKRVGAFQCVIAAGGKGNLVA